MTQQAPQVGEEMIAKMTKGGMHAVGEARKRDRGEGPFKRMVLRGATIIDGTGAPPWGPADIVVENNRIVTIAPVGSPRRPIDPAMRPQGGDHEIDCTGKFITPGFIDCHAHLGTPYHSLTGPTPPADYILRLYLSHGITTMREPGCHNGLGLTLRHKQLSEANEIVAPRIIAHAYVPAVNEMLKTIHTPEQVRVWIREVKERGADGLKFYGAPPAILKAALEEAKDLDLRTCCHHAQLAVTRTNSLQSARLGLTSTEHYYGLPESLFEDRVVQSFPLDYDYKDEYMRFSTAGQMFRQGAKPGSAKWDRVLDEYLELGHTFVPTFSIYDANRDVMRARRADWHDEYTWKGILKFYEPSREWHGAYFYRWSTSDELAWKENYRIWMQFINDYKNRGGRVCMGSDSGYIFQIFGFGYAREFELFQEAGFHPLEVIRAATLHGAELVGLDHEIGSIEVGKRADILVHNHNPLADFKLLYGTGAMRLDEESGEITWPRALAYTIKDGVVYDVDELLADVREMVVENSGNG